MEWEAYVYYRPEVDPENEKHTELVQELRRSVVEHGSVINIVTGDIITCPCSTTECLNIFVTTDSRTETTHHPPIVYNI